MAIDLYGANVTLLIERQGKLIPIQDILGSGRRIGNFIDRVNIKIGLFHLFEIEVQLSPPLKEAIDLLKTGALGLGFQLVRSTGKTATATETASTSDKKIRLNEMVIQFSYGGLSSQAFTAIMMAPEVSLGLEGIDITLKGIGYLLNSAKSTSQISKRDTRLNLIKELLGTNVTVVVAAGDEKANEALNESVEFTATKSDYESAVELISNANCVISYEGSPKPGGNQTVRIKSKELMRKGRAVATFVAYGQIDPNNAVYPLLSLSCPITNLLLPGGAFFSNDL